MDAGMRVPRQAPRAGQPADRAIGSALRQSPLPAAGPRLRPSRVPTRGGAAGPAGASWAPAGLVRSRPSGALAGTRPSAVPAVPRLDVLRDPGQPMAAPTREEMEARFGADFSYVRLHTGWTARASAAAVGARAYTSGRHIVVGDGGADKHTLAHELTHVIQQRQGPVAGTDRSGALRISDPSDRDELAAEASAARVMRAPLSQDRQARAGTGDQRAAGDLAVPRPVPRPVPGLPVAEALAAFRPVVQRKIVRVPKGGASASGWTFRRSDEEYDYYDDGVPDPRKRERDQSLEAEAIVAWDDLVERLRQWVVTEYGNELPVERIEEILADLELADPRHATFELDDEAELHAYLAEVGDAVSGFEAYFTGLTDEEPTYSKDELHLRLGRKLAGSKKARVSQNEVSVNVGLLVMDPYSGRRRFVSITVPERFSSGSFSAALKEKVKTWLVQIGVIQKKGDYRDELHAHSEQEMVQYMIGHADELANMLVSELFAGDVVLQVVTNLVSLPNTVCTPCHRSVDKMIMRVLGPGITRALDRRNMRADPQFILNISATNKFPGGKPSAEGDFAQFNEQILKLLTNYSERTAYEQVFARAAAELGQARVSVGEFLFLRVDASARQIQNIPIGMEFVLAGKVWRVAGLDPRARSVQLRLVGEQEGNKLHMG